MKIKLKELPVLRDGKLVGIITIKDIFKSGPYPNAARDKDGNY